MSDVLLTISTAGTQLILAAMGVYLAFRPPTPDRQASWLIGFIGIGFLGIVLTGWSAHRSKTTETSTNAALSNASRDAKDARDEAKRAREEAERARRDQQIAQEELRNLIEIGTKATQSSIARWRTDTDAVFGKVLQKPRILTDEQKNLLTDRLKAAGGHAIAMRHVIGNAESQDFADQLQEVLEASGWTMREPMFLIQKREVNGLWVLVQSEPAPPGADALIDALKSAGCSVQGATVSGLKPGNVDIMVGLNDVR